MSAQSFPQWRNANDAGKYPFAAHATLTNGTVFVPDTTFIDARIHAVGGGEAQCITKVVRAASTITLYVGDSDDLERCYGSFSVSDADVELITLWDDYSRPSGVLVTDATRLAAFSGWPVGTYEFDADALPFSATAITPVPAGGVSSLRGDDDIPLAGRVALVGGVGIALEVEVDADGNNVVVVHAVGDKLARVTVCGVSTTGAVPVFVGSINGSRDAYGNYNIVADDTDTGETVIRMSAAAGRIGLSLTGGLEPKKG